MIIQILFLYWLFAFANADTSTYTSNVAACKIPTNRLQPGLSVNIYSYDNSATTTLALEELYTGYTTLSRRYSNTVISSISLSAAGPTTMTTWGMTFGNEAIIIEFVSYFYVDQTGFYAFQSNNIDDGVMILIGLAAFKCGDVSGIGKGYTYLLYQQYKNPISAISDVYLEGGQYYPLRVVFFNDESAIFLNVNIQDSNSSTLDQKKVLFNDISDGDTPGCTAMYYPRAFATGCSIPSTVLQQGFDVNIYTFSSVTTLLSPSVYTSEYKSLSKVASNYGVVSSIYLNALSAYTMTNWGMTFWNSDIIIEILTYLYVEVSGIYIFQTFDTDDGVMIFIADNAFSCCDSTGIGSSNEYILYSQKLYARVTDFVDSNVYLTAGGYYPLRVIYYNLEIAAILELVILDPSGSEVNQHKALFNVPPSSQTEICELMTVYPTNSDGQPTNSDGLPVNSNGQPTNSNGAATNSNGQPTNSDGAATNSDGQPTNSNGQPTNSDGAATNSNGQPTNSDGAATNSNGQPTNSDGAATNSNGQPTNSDGAPTNSDGAATNSNGQPTNSDGAATNSNGQPTNSDGAATNSDGQPTNSNGQPTNSDGAATNSNGQPTNSDGAATNSNGQPTNSDGAPTTVMVLLPTPMDNQLTVMELLPTPMASQPTVTELLPTPMASQPTVTELLPTPTVSQPTVMALLPTPTSGQPTVMALLPTPMVNLVVVRSIQGHLLVKLLLFQVRRLSLPYLSLL
ncbi:binding protein [[Candida] boidinii]|nr:binding protein [[Candida] boidinii]